MAKLPKRLIKKFGISKRAWQEYRREQASSRSQTRGTKFKMTRRKKNIRRIVRSAIKPTAILIGAGVYGAIREPLANAITPLTSKIPLGDYADEAILIIAGWYGVKKGKGIVRDIALGALCVEGARLGEKLRNMAVPTSSATSGGMESFH